MNTETPVGFGVVMTPEKGWFPATIHQRCVGFVIASYDETERGAVHAHSVIGDFKSLDEARAACERGREAERLLRPAWQAAIEHAARLEGLMRNAAIAATEG